MVSRERLLDRSWDRLGKLRGDQVVDHRKAQTGEGARRPSGDRWGLRWRRLDALGWWGSSLMSESAGLRGERAGGSGLLDALRPTDTLDPLSAPIGAELLPTPGGSELLAAAQANHVQSRDLRVTRSRDGH